MEILMNPDKIFTENLDAEETVFFTRALEYVKKEAYDIKYAEFKAIKLIPVSTEAPAGAKTITYESYDEVGIAEVIGNYADVLPRVDIKGTEFTVKVKSVGDSYGYNIQEIQEAKMAGKPLNARRANAARKAYDRKINMLAWYGDTKYGIQGFLSNTNITASTVPAGTTSGNVPWIGASPKNPLEILEDLNNAVTNMIDLTLGIEVPDTILLPVKQYAKIFTTKLDTGSDTTIASFFLANNPSITSIEWVNELQDVNPSPDAGTTASVMIVYKKDPEKLTLELPMPYTQFAPQLKNLEYVVPAYGRCGGVIVYYPLSIAFYEGI